MKVKIAWYPRDGEVVDARNMRATPYPEVSEVLRHLQEEGYVLAVASRTGEVEGANQLLSLYGWDKHFTYKEIYPGSKIAHFERFVTPHHHHHRLVWFLKHCVPLNKNFLI